MARVPPGTRVVLLRHAESVHNQEQTKARKRGELSSFLFSGMRDTDLSVPGCMQGFLGGGFLKEKILRGCEVDVIACSNLCRAEKTVYWVKRGGGIRARQTIYADVLDEQRHGPYAWNTNVIASAKDSKGTRLEVDANAPIDLQVHFWQLFQGEYEASAAHPESDRIRKALKKASQEWMRCYYPILSRHVNLQMIQDAVFRKKTPLGERFVDLCQRAEKVLELIVRNTEEPDQARSFVIVSHAKMIIALRYLLEGLTFEMAERILQAEGPPFPPHVGMTYYVERNGVLVREGRPYQLPKQLTVRGRELFFRKIPKSDLRAMCRVLKLNEEEVLLRYR